MSKMTIFRHFLAVRPEKYALQAMKSLFLPDFAEKSRKIVIFGTPGGLFGPGPNKWVETPDFE